MQNMHVMQLCKLCKMFMLENMRPAEEVRHILFSFVFLYLQYFDISHLLSCDISHLLSLRCEKFCDEKEVLFGEERVRDFLNC